MNLDELMSVWKSQDMAPLHDVNKTLLHLALRQDEAKLQKERRRERWMMYIVSTGLFVAMAIFFSMMFYSYSGRRQITDPTDGVNTGWDLVIPIVGAAAALLWAGAMYVSQRAQSLREQRFGESLRDQLGRRIAQLDYRATKAVRLASVLALYLPPIVFMIVILLAGYRINQKPISEVGFMFFVLILFSVGNMGFGIWQERRQVQQDVLPRKQRLETLLKELDD